MGGGVFFQWNKLDNEQVKYPGKPLRMNENIFHFKAK